MPQAYCLSVGHHPPSENLWRAQCKLNGGLGGGQRSTAYYDEE